MCLPALNLRGTGGNEGADTTNSTSVTSTTIEAGAWQVSANSMGFGPELKALVLAKAGALDGNGFQRAMKAESSAGEMAAPTPVCAAPHR